MKTITIPVTTLETLIEGLQSAVNVCSNVDSKSNDSERSYPYATGYSRSAMEMIIQQLQVLKSQTN
jgi:hypothetical protein